MRSLMSTSSNFVIFISVSKGGCDELVHHLETVVGAQPNCLESHRLDFFFSARTTFRRLRSLLAVIVVRLIFGTKIGIIFQIITRNSKNLQKSCKFSELSSLYTLNNYKSCVTNWLNLLLWMSIINMTFPCPFLHPSNNPNSAKNEQIRRIRDGSDDPLSKGNGITQWEIRNRPRFSLLGKRPV